MAWRGVAWHRMVGVPCQRGSGDDQHLTKASHAMTTCCHATACYLTSQEWSHVAGPLASISLAHYWHPLSRQPFPPYVDRTCMAALVVVSGMKRRVRTYRCYTCCYTTILHSRALSQVKISFISGEPPMNINIPTRFAQQNVSTMGCST